MTPNQTDSNPSVAIFRKRLLSYSETFIADQGLFLSRYRPLYCGYARDRSGIELIEKADRILLSDLSRHPGLSKLVFRTGLDGAGAWIDAIGRQQPALIHAHFFNDGIDALKLGKRLGRPVVTTLHGHDITKQPVAGSSRGPAAKFFDRVDCVIAVSKFIAEQAIRRGCPESKIRQHYIGIDLEKFDREKNETDYPSLLFVGRLVEKKGCTYLLRAMEKINARFPGLRLTIVGDGDLRQPLQQEAQARALNADFVGSATPEQVRDHLARSWLFVAPSIVAGSGDAEGLGMVFLEAQALRTPVVSFRSGGLVEAVADGSSALLCDEKDVDALADNIARLLQDPELRQNMGIAGRDRVEQDFDVRRQCVKLERIYDSLR